FLDDHRPLRKSDVVALLARRGVRLNSYTVKRSVEWLFDYRYINRLPGPIGGPHPTYKYALNPTHPQWPPKNLKPPKQALERLPIKPDDKRTNARSRRPSAVRAKVRTRIAAKVKRSLTG